MSQHKNYVSAIERLAGLSQAALICREVGHSWPPGVPLNPTVVRGKTVKEADRVLKCQRDCEVQRTEKYERSEYGGLVRYSSQYKYPDGYKLVRDDPTVPMERVSADQVRSALMTRMFPDLKW